MLIRRLRRVTPQSEASGSGYWKLELKMQNYCYDMAEGGGESAEVTHVSLCGDMRSDKSLEGGIEGWSNVVEVERNTRIE